MSDEITDSRSWDTTKKEEKQEITEVYTLSTFPSPNRSNPIPKLNFRNRLGSKRQPQNEHGGGKSNQSQKNLNG